METVLRCVAIIGLAVLGAAVAYYRASAKLQAKATELINQAEGMYTDVTKAGGQRFEWVVDQLYELSARDRAAHSYPRAGRDNRAKYI